MSKIMLYENTTFFQEITDIDKNAESRKYELKKDFNNKMDTLHKNTKKFYLIFLCIFVTLTILIGVMLGSTVYKYEYIFDDVIGPDEICYVTNYGECYHSLSCGYLKSINQTTVKKAVRAGYRRCSACDVGKTEIVSKTEQRNNPWKGIKTSAVIFVAIFIILFIFKTKSNFNKKDNWIQYFNNNTDKETTEAKEKISKILQENGLLKISGAPEEIKLQNGKLYSKNEDMYRYVSIYGKCYHSKSNCGNKKFFKKFIFYINGLEPCSKCAEKIPATPKWFLKYQNLISIIKKYKIEMHENSDTKQSNFDLLNQRLDYNLNE